MYKRQVELVQLRREAAAEDIRPRQRQKPDAGTLAGPVSYTHLDVYKRQVGNRSVIDVQMNDDSQMLAETVVIGYGSDKKRDLTGSITKDVYKRQVLKKSVDNTLALLRRELEIRRNEILESLHFSSLEKIFIEERIYKDKEFEQAKNMDAACEHIDERLTPYYPTFIREVSKEDILKLMEIKMARILKFNSDKDVYKRQARDHP